MKFSTALSLLAAASSALAQNQNMTVLTGLLQALQDANLTSLLSVASQVNGTSTGESLFAALSNGMPYVLFAPSNEAFDNAPMNATENLADTIAYHVVMGNFTGDSSMYPNTTLGRTFLNDSMYVQLEGNQSQVLAWAKMSDGMVHILNQPNDTMVTNMTSYGNITINVINNVLQFPSDLSHVVDSDMNASLSELQTVLHQVSMPYYNMTSMQTMNMSTFDVLNMGTHGFTLFAPNSSALDMVASTLQSLSSNMSLVDTILKNHIINGTSAYSSELVGQNYVSAAGETISFTVNSTGHYVTSGNTTAMIIQPDVLLSNGVIHVINGVFVNEESNPSAASSAVASATSAAAAAATSTETAPIGYSQTAGLMSGSSAGASATSSKSAAMGMFAQTGAAQMWAMAATVFGAVVGGVMILA